MDAKINHFDKNVLNFASKNTVPWFAPRKFQQIDKYYKHANYSEPVKFAKGYVARGITGIFGHKEDLFFVTFKNEFQKLFEAGITNVVKLNSSKSFDEKVMNSKLHKDFTVYDEKKELVPMSMSQLSAGFIIWFSAILIVILVFFLEILYYKLSQVWEQFLFDRETKFNREISK